MPSQKIRFFRGWKLPVVLGMGSLLVGAVFAAEQRVRYLRFEEVAETIWLFEGSGRPGGGEKPIKPVSGTAQRASLPPSERPGQCEIDTRGPQAYGFAQG
jgi:hypothetical protein